jgi:glycosyltransferase involved in cell wall biosynthesis
MVATLEPKKAQDVLLRAVPMVLAAFPAAHFALVGGSHSPGDALTGSYEGDLRRLARSLGVAERVHFLGFRPRAAALLPDLDVSVLCSRHEALGLAAVESMAAGVPLAATAVEGLLEVVEDGVTGLLVPPDDPSSLARSINALLGNRTLAATLAANGRREARARFDANHLAALNRKVYEELLQNKHRH